MSIKAELRGIYNIDKSYAENVEYGPEFSGEIPKRIWRPKNEWIDFLGYSVASPLGVPAGPLLNSQWTTLAAQLGFDIVTYKTIRSKAYAGHPLPNVILVNSEKDGNTMQECLELPIDPCKISITNSFGMPSMSPEYLQNDIAKAKMALKPGQLLIVSVVGSPGFSEDLAEDFVRTAIMAKEAGAQAIEANFSCPNVTSKEGCLYSDPENSYVIAHKIAKAISPLPLMIKVGKYSDREKMRQVFLALAKAKVRAICGINSLSMHVTNADGLPALGKGRETSGICGDMIRPAALEFLKDARAIISKEKLELELAGCGGIMLPQHFDKFLETGCKVAMSATGMMWNPYLAAKWHENQKPKEKK